MVSQMKKPKRRRSENPARSLEPQKKPKLQKPECKKVNYEKKKKMNMHYMHQNN